MIYLLPGVVIIHCGDSPVLGRLKHYGVFQDFFVDLRFFHLKDKGRWW